MADIIGAIVLGAISILCFIFSYFQFNEKGFLFNNAYIYASKQKREKMNKKPYYKQSGVVFLLLGLIFSINAVELIIKSGWLIYAVISVIIITIVYSVISSVIIEKRKG